MEASVKADLRSSHFGFGHHQNQYQTTNVRAFSAQGAKRADHFDKKQQDARKAEMRGHNFELGAEDR